MSQINLLNIRVGDSNYHVYCEGPVRGSWSLNQLPDPAFQERLGARLAELGVRRAFAPNAGKMSGVILPPEKFDRVFELPHQVTLRTSTLPCDGTFLIEQGDALVLDAAGCPLLGIPETGCFGHAGRNSLLDRKLIHEGKASRSDRSVIDAMARLSLKRHTEPLRLYSFCEIPTEHFPHLLSHPEHGERNLELWNYVEREWKLDIMRVIGNDLCLDLSRLIQLQGEAAGLCTEAGDYPLPRGGNFAYTTHPNPAFGGAARNLLVAYLT